MRASKAQLTRLLALLAIAVVVWLRSGDLDVLQQSPNTIEQAFANGRSDVLVTDRGRVIRILADDNDGTRHQRFILEVDSKVTVLVAHNIDLASRIPDLRMDETVEFHGEYEWNEQGGVIHWTHRDPQGTHEEGWLKHAGELYD